MNAAKGSRAGTEIHNAGLPNVKAVEHFRLWELVGGSSVLIMGEDIFFGLGGGVARM